MVQQFGQLFNVGMSSSHLQMVLLTSFLLLAPATQASSAERCDELMCRSPGLYGGYGCWALVGSDPTPSADAPLCDGESVAVSMENVPQVESAELGGTFYYYTCCPFTSNITTIPADTEPLCAPFWDEFCGDQGGDCFADVPGEPMVCLDDIYKYPHKTGSIFLYESQLYSQYRCCKDPQKAIQATETSSPEQSITDQCDELMCRSPGLYGLYGGYDCWALVGSDPTPSADAPLCDGGYVAVPMENVPQVESVELGGTIYYYTCCPSTSNIATVPADIEPFCAPFLNGFCGDLAEDCFADVPGEPMVCLDDIYKYPHKTGSIYLHEKQLYSQYRCCKDPQKAIQATETSSPEQSITDQCDELMCRSPGLHGGYGCWALVGSDPTPSADAPLCDGGYVAVPMENVPQVQSYEFGGNFNYYTCCPSTSNITTIPAEIEPFCAPFWNGFCGDQGGDCIADVPGAPMVCLDDIYKYPHKTGSTFLYESQLYSQYRCCKDPQKAIQATETSSPEQSSADQCDELMCRSPGLYGLYGGYDCWEIIGSDPTPSADAPLCDGGYVAVPMENVPQDESVELGGTTYYYTCCPSTSNITTIPAEIEPFCAPFLNGFCGDLAEDCFADVPGEPMACLDDIYKYPQKTGSIFLHEKQLYSQYRCCKDPQKAIQATETPSPEQSITDQCDELMCRSPGLYGLHGGYGCWALVGSDPTPSADAPLCDGGYVAVPMENVPQVQSYEFGGNFNYYTCCPSTSNITTIPAEIEPFCAPFWNGFCGDQGGDCIADAPGEPMACLDDIYKYPHKTGYKLLSNAWLHSQYRCCKEPPENARSSIFVPEICRIVSGIISSILTFTMVVGILLSETARKQTFNLYVVFAVLGDFFASLVMILVGSLEISQTNPPNLCTVPYTFAFFSTYAGLWMNAIAIREVLMILLSSKRAIRTSPPTVRKTLVQAFVVYILAGGTSSSTAILKCTRDPWLNVALLILVMVMIVPPVTYAVYAGIRVWKQQLLPKTGRTRFLYIYFLRITIAAFMPLPMSLMYIFGYNSIHGLEYILNYVGVILNCINVFLVLTKPDIRQAVKKMLTCRCYSDDISSERASRLHQSLTNLLSSRLSSRLSGFHSKEVRKESSNLEHHNKPLEQNETNHIDAVRVSLKDDEKDEFFDNEKKDEFLDPPKDSTVEPGKNFDLSSNFL